MFSISREPLKMLKMLSSHGELWWLQGGGHITSSTSLIFPFFKAHFDKQGLEQGKCYVKDVELVKIASSRSGCSYDLPHFAGNYSRESKSKVLVCDLPGFGLWSTFRCLWSTWFWLMICLPFPFAEINAFEKMVDHKPKLSTGAKGPKSEIKRRGLGRLWFMIYLPPGNCRSSFFGKGTVYDVPFLHQKKQDRS